MSDKAIPIFCAVTGSRLYGNSRPESDWDYRGVVISPLSRYFGFTTCGLDVNKGTYKDLSKVELNGLNNLDDRCRISESDTEFYDIRKFFIMTHKCSPNIIELLFCDNLISDNSIWSRIVENRHHFLSSRVKYSFSNFAYDQLKKLRNHKLWVGDNVEKPERSDFGLSDIKEFNKSQLKALSQFSDEKLKEYFNNDDVFERFKSESDFFKSYGKYKHYLEYKHNRNPARYELEQKYGYDTKDASNLVRLFYEAERLLLEGRLIFPLPEIDIVNAVRNGEWTYDKLVEFAENSDANLTEIMNSDKCVLPKKPNTKVLDELLQEIIWEHFKLMLD